MNSAEDRPDPDAVLRELRRGEQGKKTGKLFIFLGMCPGVGKTCAMLQAALARQKEGFRVLAGVVETHGRPETAALLAGLEQLPPVTLPHRGLAIGEFDIDAALKKAPDILLVDELAHTNAPGSRHAKRYQDVLEVLEAGIDVYTTLNIQHIESQVDVIRQITGVSVQETVPDSVLDVAHDIQLIDLSVEKLLERMAEGKVYTGERAGAAVNHFFREANLTALRELALRFTAACVDRDLAGLRRSRGHSPWKTSARLMACVSASPWSEGLVRWTRRAAAQLNCSWLVVWVESSQPLSAAAQDRLARTLGMARKLGGEVVTVTGEDTAEALLRVARERHVTQIIVGKPERRSFLRTSPADRLIRESGDIDVCAVRPPFPAAGGKTTASPAPPVTDSLIAEYSTVLAGTFLLGVTGRGVLPHAGYMSVGLIFLLGIVLAALKFRRGPVLLMAVLSALSWNFFFIEPLYTLRIGTIHDLIMFATFFIVAFSMGHLTSRLRERETSERHRQKLTAALLRVTQSAALSAEPARGLSEALRTIDGLLSAETALVVRNSDHSLPSSAHPAGTFTPPPLEWGVIAWAHQHKQPAGRFTETLPASAATWFPLQTATSVMGVLGIKLPAKTAVMDFGTRQAIEAFALQLALVLEKEHFVQAIQQVEVLTRSERLQRTLLDSVSHELKTPLAVIEVSLEALAPLRNPYLEEIQTASKRLQRVVNNLLQMTRIESLAVQPQPEWCVPADLIEQARDLAGDSLAKRTVQVHAAPDLPAVKIDAGLFSQAAASILHNAGAYTPEGTPVNITAAMEDGSVFTLTISDRGPGLPGDATEQVFQKFYRLPGSPPGGTGLGLSIARALIRCLGGDITARNRSGGGAEFIISVPVETLSES